MPRLGSWVWGRKTTEAPILFLSHLNEGPTISMSDSAVGLDPDLAEVIYGRSLGCEDIAFQHPVLWPLELNVPEASSDLRLLCRRDGCSLLSTPHPVSALENDARL